MTDWTTYLDKVKAFIEQLDEKGAIDYEVPKYTRVNIAFVDPTYEYGPDCEDSGKIQVWINVWTESIKKFPDELQLKAPKIMEQCVMEVIASILMITTEDFLRDSFGIGGSDGYPYLALSINDAMLLHEALLKREETKLSNIEPF